MKLLALDTTEDTCSVALSIDDALIERFELAPRRHSELILPMMDALLAEAGIPLSALDALAFARGPGGFTGVRIAASIVQGAAFGADLPVVPVSSLQALAQGCAVAHDADAVLAALDARMGEVYWGAFRRGVGAIMRAVGDEVVSKPAAVPVPEGGGWSAVGSGWQAYANALSACCAVPSAVYADARVHADAVAQLALVLFAEGHAVAAEQALPVYLRDQVAWAKS